MSDAGYFSTIAAAAYIGVCTKTFQRMIEAIPQGRRPVQVAIPGTSLLRWRKGDLDEALSKASPSAKWDKALGGGDGKIMGRRRARRS